MYTDCKSALAALQQALTNYHVVQLHYQAMGGAVTTRLVEPFALLLSTQENWVLVGWCRLRHAYRIFRLDRIQRLDTLTETFPPHCLTLAQYFASLRG